MNIRADEHVSPVIVDAINKLAPKGEWRLSSVSEVGHSGASDVHWITDFAQNNGDAILTADRDFQKTPPQVKAVFDLGLKVIQLPKRWAQAGAHLQAAHLLMWWPRIIGKLTVMSARECYAPVWNISDAQDLKKVPLQFDKAQRRIRKSKKR